MKDTYSAQNWQSIISTVSSQIGVLREWSIVVTIKDSTVSYFAGSNRDISSLSSNLEGITIRPIDPSLISAPDGISAERFINSSTGNVLDIKEKYQVKRGKSLEILSVSFMMITSTKSYCNTQLYFVNSLGDYSLSNKLSIVVPAYLFAIDFSTSTKYLRKKQPKYLDIQKSLQIMRSDDMGAIFEVDTFPYAPRNYYLPLESYDFDKHSFIIGSSGSGKSKLIGSFISKLLSNGNYRHKYRLVVIDPHASLEDDLGSIDGCNIISFKNPDDGAGLFADAGTDISAATELTGTLFKSLLADQHNPKLERVLRFSLYILMTGQVMSLDNLKRFLTDIDFRNQLIDHVNRFVPENVIKFFGSDFNELRTKYYNESISPIVSLVEEMQMQPSIGNLNEDSASLVKIVNSNPLTVFSLNKVSMGEKVVKTVAGLIIQQIFLLAQARSFSEKIILIIDEVSVVQNPAIAQILAEARKYNLFVFLTQQYFGQIEKDLQDAIFTNASNYYVFRVSEEDARALEGNLTIEIPKELLLEEKEVGSKEQELRVKILTSLNNRECLLRLSNDGQILPCIKARTMDYVGSRKPKNIELQTFTETHLPSKFQENIIAQQSALEDISTKDNIYKVNDMTSFMGSITSQDPADNPYSFLTPDIAKPSQQQPPPTNRSPSLMDFLSAQSSSPTKQKKG